jgi:tRNA threonylcarbamoyladenosine modification (KEOPS) complex  Pcc1 subunit
MKRTIAEVAVDFESSNHAMAVFKAINPETLLPPTQRSKVKVQRRGRLVLIHFEANDVVALRASMNAILRYLLGLWKTAKSLKELEKASKMK